MYGIRNFLCYCTAFSSFNAGGEIKLNSLFYLGSHSNYRDTTACKALFFFQNIKVWARWINNKREPDIQPGEADGGGLQIRLIILCNVIARQRATPFHSVIWDGAIIKMKINAVIIRVCFIMLLETPLSPLWHKTRLHGPSEDGHKLGCWTQNRASLHQRTQPEQDIQIT